jgi:hypothetical protein
MVVETNRAACVLVVWAHHVLGLSVVVNVRSRDGHTIQTTRFGTTTERVILQVPVPDRRPSPHAESATLLCSDGTKLFELVSDPDDDLIESTFRVHACGVGKRMIEIELRPWRHAYGSESLKKEIELLALAITMRFTEELYIDLSMDFDIDATVDPPHLSREDPNSNDSSPQEGDSHGSTAKPLPYHVTKDAILEASRFIFNDSRMKLEKASEYIGGITGETLYHIPMPPGVISSCLRGCSEDEKEKIWSDVRFLAMNLGVLIYAFAHVIDLNACGDLPVMAHYPVLRMSPLMTRLSGWPIGTPLVAGYDDSFLAISYLMLGEVPELDLLRASLVSKAGWSVFFSTITDADPIHVSKFSATPLYTTSA